MTNIIYCDGLLKKQLPFTGVTGKKLPFTGITGKKLSIYWRNRKNKVGILWDVPLMLPEGPG